MSSKTAVLATLSAVAILFSANLAAAQDRGSGPGHEMTMGRGMMGGGMMGGGMGMMGGCPMMGGMMGGRVEGRIAFLRAELAITDAQKSAFDALADAMRKSATSMHTQHEGMSKSEAKTPVEKLDQRIAMMEGRLGAMKEARAPLAALYATLSDEQKKNADALLGMGCAM